MEASSRRDKEQSAPAMDNPGKFRLWCGHMSEGGHTLTGDIRHHPGFASRLLGNRRDVLVYLPPGYARSRRRFPVFYMQDGQNVFDAATSFAGQEWGADETAERMISERRMSPVIIVAVANAGEDRIHEYTPTRGHYHFYGEARRSKGLGNRYGRFLSEELKPFIDMHYRTRPEGDSTGLGGSSLGGLVTLALALRQPKDFTRLAVMSPSVWWDDCIVYKLVDDLKAKPSLKIWLDTGTGEPGWERTGLLRDRLVAKGWIEGQDLVYKTYEGAGHNEGAWAARLDEVLRYLYPPKGR